jgi:hypothetical protein
MNKSAVLLLTGKFEAFLEDAAEDFLFAVNQVGAKGKHIPTRIMAEHSVEAVRGVEQSLRRGDTESIRAVFGALARYWVDAEPCAALKVSCKFNYGKHGDREVIRLFKRMGIDDVFATVTVMDETAGSYDGGAPAPFDVQGLVNSLTQIRNNILHQDKSPNLTPVNLRKQCAALKSFAMALVDDLQIIVDGIAQKTKADVG